MSDSPIDRSLIEAAREGLGPAPADRDRLKRNVLASIAASAAAGSAASGASASVAATKLLGWKLVVGIATVSVAVVGGATWIATEANEPTRSATAHSSAPPRARPVDVPSTRPTEPPIDTVVADVAADEPPAVERPVARARRSAIAPSSEPVAPADSLRRETALLRDARRALLAHAPDRALALLAQHAAEHPNGALREERLATRILALCDAQRIDEARRESASFLAAHPDSMHAPRVRAACGATEAAP